MGLEKLRGPLQEKGPLQEGGKDLPPVDEMSSLSSTSLREMINCLSATLSCKIGKLQGPWKKSGPLRDYRVRERLETPERLDRSGLHG